MSKHFRVYEPFKSKSFDIESQIASSIFLSNSASLTSFQRYAIAGSLFFLSFFSTIYALMHLPFAALSPRSFLLPLDISEILVLSGIAVFEGFKKFQKTFFSNKKTFPISLINCLLLFFSLYSSFVYGTYLRSLLLAIFQLAGLVLWIACAIPGGLTGIARTTKAFLRSISLFFRLY